MKLLISYGSLGKLFHLEEFSHALEKQNVQVKLVKSKPNEIRSKDNMKVKIIYVDDADQVHLM